MKKKIKLLLALVAAFAVIAAVDKPSKAYAINVTPISIELYSTSGTPVYAVPDVFSNIVVVLDRFVNVRVTGITDNGFYRVDIGGTYYIPGPFMVAQVNPPKSEKQKALENLNKVTEAYRMQLGFMESYSPNFALIDVTGDGIPEIFDASGKEIYTYYNERPVMIYYSGTPMTFYYSKNDNRLYGKYYWNGKAVWEGYFNDTSLLPWGQLKCDMTLTSAPNAAEISRNYTNNEDTRNDMYNILYGILIGE